MEMLGKLFGSESRVKILRLFLFNPDVVFSAEGIAERSKSNLYTAKHELKILRKVGFVKRKTRKKPPARRGAKRTAGNAAEGWMLDEQFTYFKPLRALLLDTVLLNDKNIYRRFAGAGKLKVVVAAGIFIQHTESRLDLLIAGDGLKKQVIEHAVKGLEAEIGKEISYAAFNLSELHYRVSMYDRLLRDMVENPHRTLLDTVGFEGAFAESRTVKK